MESSMRRFVFSVVLMTSLLSSSSVVQAGSAEAEFTASYPVASERLEGFYKRLAMRIVTENQSPQETRTRRTAIYESNGDCVRVVRTDHDKGDRELVWVLGTSLSFQLTKQRDQSQYFLADIRRSMPKGWQENFWHSAPLTLAPYGCLGLRVIDWMAEPGFSIHQISEEGKGAERAVRVDWTCVFKDPGETIKREGSFFFLPAQAWVLREFSIGYANRPARMRCLLEYDTRPGHEFPIIRQSRTWTDTPDRREFVEVVRAEDVLVQSAEAGRFQLSSFGIPDRVSGRAFDRSWGWLLVGTVGLVIAVVLKRMATRRKP